MNEIEKFKDSNIKDATYIEIKDSDANSKDIIDLIYSEPWNWAVKHHVLVEDTEEYIPSFDFSYVIVATDKHDNWFMLDCSDGFSEVDAFPNGNDLNDSHVLCDVELEPLCVYKLSDFLKWCDRDYFGDVDDWGYTAQKAEKLYQIGVDFINES